MPLTPSAVANKEFRLGFRGYVVHEVDAFLDEVEAELTRLLTAAAAGPARSSAVASPSAGEAAGAEPGALEGQEAALRTLLLAQRTADEAIAEARAEAEQILATAREEATALQTAAREQAEAALAASRADAERVEQELAQRRDAALGELERRRQRLEADVEELQAFEREYRTRLRAYLEGQLRELDGPGGGDDTGTGVPVGAGGAAVGRPDGGAVRLGSRTSPDGPSPRPLQAVAAAAGSAPDRPSAAPDPAAPTADH